MSVTIKLKRGNASDWTSQNITLASGEPGYELDTGRLKIGDGSTAWNSLSYASVIPTGILAGSGINVNLGSNGSTATISVSGLNSTYISDFNEAVDDRIGSGLFVAGTGINLSYNDAGNTFTVSVTGLIANPTNNRILSSRDSTTTGIDAESNLLFDGALLTVSGDLIANTGTFSIIQLDTDNGAVSAQGQLGWNDTDGTVDIALTDTAIINVGEHTTFRLRNTTGNTLYKGQPVYASGVHANGLITPNLYVADASIREIRFIGLIYENINDNNNGYAVNFGHIYNIDTRGNVATQYAVGDETWLDGDILYVHPTIPGKLTKIEPKHSIAAAIILDAASNGKIFVRPTSYGHLDDNHDVNISGVTNGQFLQYNSSTDYWVPSSSGNFSTLLVNGTGVSVNGHTHTSSDITDFNSSVSGLLPTIANNADNRVLTSTGTTTGINAESNLTFNGSTLTVTGIANVDNLRLDGNTLSSTNTNGNIIVAPNGSGPVQFSSSGNTRGSYAVDLQRLQTTTQVASGNYSTIGGGRNNTASGYISTISGGQGNLASATRSTVGGGISNSVSAVYGTISGGRLNSVSGARATICGGQSNTCSSTYGFIGGGNNHNISINSTRSTIAGGRSHTTSGNYTTIAGGFANNCLAASSSIVGGNLNTIFSGSFSSFIAGGSSNTTYAAYTTISAGIFNNITATGGYSTIGGGGSNNIAGVYGTIAGGAVNSIIGQLSYYSTIGGGVNNQIRDSQEATICGGTTNTITSSRGSVISGGFSNVVSSAPYGNILGGSLNTITSSYTTITGGRNAVASLYGEEARSSGRFVTNGDAQVRKFILRNKSTTGSPVILFLDGSSEELIIPENSTWFYTIKIVGRDADNIESAGYKIEGVLERNSLVTLLLSETKTISYEDNPNWDTDLSIVNNDTTLRISCTVESGQTNVYWVAYAEIVQVVIPSVVPSYS